MATHLTRRGSIYYLRRRIPLHLIQQYNGKREITRSLGTKSRPEAERLARVISVEPDREWQAASEAAAMAAETSGEPRTDPRYYDLAGSFELAEIEEQHAAEVDALHDEADRLERLLTIIERRRKQRQGPVAGVYLRRCPHVPRQGQSEGPQPAQFTISHIGCK